MKKTLLFAAVAALFTIASCQKEVTPIHDQNGDLVFTATIAGQEAKTTIDASNGKVSWVSEDEITIKDAAKTAVKYTVSSIDTQGKATFTKKAGEAGTLGAGPYTAVYGTDPATSQTYSATVPALPMSAESTTTALTFAVSCGLLELSMTAGESITSIEVKGTPTGGSETTYTLSCTSPVSIASGAKFYIALPAGSYTSFLLNGENGAQCYKDKSGSSIAIAANTIQPVSLTNLHFAVQLWKDGPWWATTNIGAETKFESGQNFSWGYSEGCVRNSGNTGWVLASDGTTVKTFSTDPTTGFPSRSIDEFVDAATVNWGTGWQVPSKSDIENLLSTSNTDIVLVSYGDIGLSIKGKGDYASHSIFIPQGLCGYNADCWPDGSYWSRDLMNTNNAYTLFFSTVTEEIKVGEGGRSYGVMIRPVRASVAPSTPTIPDGALSGVFSVSATEKVYFSKGNMYYDGSAFKFEDNQYSFANSWSTSHVSHFFWSKTASVAYASSYFDGSATDSDVFFTNATTTTPKSDFTVSGATGIWRTLSKDEWTYLLSDRGIGDTYFKCVVTVCGKKNCLVIAPDGNTTSIASSYDATAWATAEANGFVCLPAAGRLEDSDVKQIDAQGYYWLSTTDDEILADALNIGDSSVIPNGSYGRDYAASVRLVTSAK